MSKHKRNRFPGTEIGKPVPDEHAFDGYNDVFPVWLDGSEKGLRIRSDIFVKPGVTLLIQDADVHGSGVQIDAAIVLMLLGVESHKVSSLG